MRLSTKEVELLARMAKRVKSGKITTQKQWFESNCRNLGLDLDVQVSKLANNRIIARNSLNNFWPVFIMISN